MKERHFKKKKKKMLHLFFQDKKNTNKTTPKKKTPLKMIHLFPDEILWMKLCLPLYRSRDSWKTELRQFICPAKGSCRYSAITRGTHGHTRILLKSEAAADVPCPSCLSRQQEPTPQKELCLRLYSADGQRHKWTHGQKASPYKFQLHLQPWNF